MINILDNSIIRNGLILSAFALVTTGLISLTHQGTRSAIADQEQQKLLSILNAIVDQSSYDNDIQHDCVVTTDLSLLGTDEPQRAYLARLSGQPVAAAIETVAPDGYSGKIELVVGVTGDGQVTGVRVLNHKETPGLGDKIDLRISDWILSFNNQAVEDNNESIWAVQKDGGKFDQFTGATITPRAVVKAVKNTVIYYQQNKQLLFTGQNRCASDNALNE